jgi:hypothetical protein
MGLPMNAREAAMSRGQRGSYWGSAVQPSGGTRRSPRTGLGSSNATATRLSNFCRPPDKRSGALPRAVAGVARKRYDRGAIRGHGHGVDRVGVAGEGVQLVAGLELPHLERLVRGGGHRAPAVRGHGHGPDPAGVTGEGVQLVAGLQLPHLERPHRVLRCSERLDHRCW